MSDKTWAEIYGYTEVDSIDNENVYFYSSGTGNYYQFPHKEFIEKFVMEDSRDVRVDIKELAKWGDDLVANNKVGGFNE